MPNKIRVEWSGELTAPQKAQLATFVAALAPDCDAPLSVSFARDRNTGVVSWSLSGEKTIAALADLPVGRVEILDKA